MISNFIVCFKESVRDGLIKKGFTLMKSQDNSNGSVYTFENSNKMQFAEDIGFSKKELMFTNKLSF